MAHLVGVVEYTDLTPSECPRYDTKKTDGEALVMLELWGIQSIPFIAITPRSTLAWSSST